MSSVNTSDSSFDQCWVDLNGDPAIKGSWNPIYTIIDLTIQSPHFTYSLKYPASQQNARVNKIFWLPGLGSVASELTHDYVNLGKSSIYLLDGDGFLARPLDLLGLFHEIGHIETYPTLPHSSDTLSHGYLGEPLPYTAKRAAYQLQREEAANTWMVERTRPLFEDLGISPELIDDFARHVQPRSYHDLINRRFLNPPVAP